MKVQIVDDHETNLLLFSQLVQAVDRTLEVETYADPRDGLLACREAMPDLIVVDYMMPDLDGHQYIEHVRRMPAARDVPIIMITAADERSVRQRALELGATDFLSKPVDPNEVRVRLKNLLALRRNHLKLQDRNKWLADSVRDATKVIVDRERELVMRLARAAEFRDPETGGHIQRMAHYSEIIARELGESEEYCDLLLKAAPMHDVGKLGTPDIILLKPGKLTESEFEVMKQHALIGFKILDGSASRLIQLAAEVAISHHEKYDGTGYPNKLAGDAIPLSGRIVAVADVFDAFTSKRPYKEPWPLDRAVQFLRDQSGSHLDPGCVAAFLRRWEDILAIRAQYQDDTGPDMARPDVWR